MAPLYEVVTLDMLKVAGAHHLDEELFAGAQRPELLLDFIAGALVAQLNAFVLAEDAGPVVAETVRVMLPHRPRWLPRWVWRRIPSVGHEFRLEVRPRWVYPQATVRVDGLGPARLLVTHLARPERAPDWWSDL